MLPVSYGSHAFLKALSTQGEGPIYLAALRGKNEPWVIKTMLGQGAVALDALKADTRILSRMRSPHLVTVLPANELDQIEQIENDGGFVMEYVPGKSLEEICQRATDYSVLLPPELGLILAHDAFTAAELFHAFEGKKRVHGNISPRTIRVSYSGDVKIAGYRPGSHVSADPDVHVVGDLKPLANMLYDLHFEMFPKELAKVVPRLLEDHVSPAEAMAAVRSFLHDQVPSADHRRKVAEWLNDLFPGQRDEEARETERLMAAGTRLLGPSSVRTGPKRMSLFGATIAMLALVGGGGLLMAQRWPGKANSELRNVEPMPQMALEQSLPAVHPTPKPTAPLAPVPVAPTEPIAPTGHPTDHPNGHPTGHPIDLATDLATAPTSGPQPTADATDNRPTKRGSEKSPAERLLRSAEAAFDAGRRIEAVHLGIQALNAGGGVRAQLALGEYYRSMHRYREALNHYRAALESEPENKLALAGVSMLEKKLTPCQ